MNVQRYRSKMELTDATTWGLTDEEVQKTPKRTGKLGGDGSTESDSKDGSSENGKRVQRIDQGKE